jgi:hypothetical protein
MPRSTAKVGASATFDDFITFYARGEISPWRLKEGTTDIYYSSRGVQYASVGIFTDTLSSGLTAQVMADSRARAGLLSAQLCDTGSGGCTTAKTIGGDLAKGDGLACPSGQFMSGISHNSPICTDEVRIVCNQGQAMIGIGPDGQAICSTPPCNASFISLCNSSVSLPVGSDGATTTVSAGDNFKDTFKCQAGSWVSTGSTGSCKCTPETKTVTASCGTGFTGSIEQQHSMICPEGTWTSFVQISNTCECVGANQTRDLCPAGTGYSGHTLQQRAFVCSGEKAGAWSAWTDLGKNTCACSSGQPKFQTIGCPGAEKGSITQTSSFDCSTGKWSAWQETENSCVCDASATDTQTVACPDSYTGADGKTHYQTGEITQTRSAVCPAGGWSSWVETKRKCKDKPEVICHWASKGGSTTASFTAGGEVGSNCTCGTTGACHIAIGSGSYNIYRGCSCE